MFRNDDPTATGVMPAVAPAGTPGYFTVGNPATGTAATRVTQDWANIVQEELMALLTMANVTPNKANLAQATQAILAMSALQDSGTAANTLVVNTRVAMTGVVTGTRICVSPAYTNTGAATLNFSGNGAVPVVRPDGSPAQPGDIVAARLLDLVYWGGSWVMLNPWKPAVFYTAQNFYVNAQTGNDSNPGTSAQPWQSLQKADAYLRQFNINSQSVTVNCSGNFSAGLSVLGPYPGGTGINQAGLGPVTYAFTAGSSIAVASGHAIVAGGGTNINVTGPVTLSSTSGNGIYAYNAATIYFSGSPIFGACLNHITSNNQGAILCDGSYSIIGGAQCHILASINATVSIDHLATGITITLSGTPAFSVGFAGSDHCSTLLCSSAHVAFSGAATGPRFAVSSNSVIDTAGSSPTSFFPGSTTPSSPYPSGGQYI